MHKGCINIKIYTCRGWDVLPDTEGCTPSQPARLPADHILIYRTDAQGQYKAIQGYIIQGYIRISSVSPCYIVACPGVQVISALYGFYMPLYTVYKGIPHKGSINGSKGHIQVYRCIVNSVQHITVTGCICPPCRVRICRYNLPL